ncbi:superoxide dismutase [Cu-Zn] [Ciona intestinalis]
MKLFLLFTLFVASVAGSKYAHCMFKQQGPVSGHICFTEKHGGQVEAHVQVSGLDRCENYRVHVHENAPASDGSCAPVGGHYNWADPENIDEGDMATLKSNTESVLHKHIHPLNSALSLNGERPIVGRSVAIHVGGHKVCCPIVACSRRTYQHMTRNLESYVHPPVCP